MINQQELLKYKNKKNDKEQDQLIDLVRCVYRPGTFVFLIGDFNCFPWSKDLHVQDKKYVNLFSFQKYEGLEMDKYVNLFPLRMYTNTKQDKCYDNIIVPDKNFCLSIDVIMTGYDLKKVSDHFLICTDFHFPTASLEVLTSNFFYPSFLTVYVLLMKLMYSTVKTNEFTF